MAILPVNVNDSPNYTPAEHADHHNVLHAFNNAQSGFGHTLGYAQAVANQGSIGGSDTDLTNLSVTVTVPSGARIKITGHVVFSQASASGITRLRIKESTTQLADSLLSATNGSFYSVDAFAVLTPTAGSHTYKLAMTTTPGTATMEAGATFPAFILVEDIT